MTLDKAIKRYVPFITITLGLLGFSLAIVVLIWLALRTRWHNDHEK